MGLKGIDLEVTGGWCVSCNGSMHVKRELNITVDNDNTEAMSLADLEWAYEHAPVAALAA